MSKNGHTVFEYKERQRADYYGFQDTGYFWNEGGSCDRNGAHRGVFGVADPVLFLDLDIRLFVL